VAAHFLHSHAKGARYSFLRMSSPQPSFSRRQFLRTSAAAAGVLGFPAILHSQNKGEKLRLVIIGCGGRGGANLREFANENIVALCDVNDKSLQAASYKHPNAVQFRDFRKLYDELKEPEYDAVVVSTTEHTHAFATLPALRLKKHVYCEKPLTRDVKEARLVTQVAKGAGVVTQMGTQVHASANYHRVVELIQDGAIGPVREAHVWVARAWGRQSKEDAEKNKDIVYVEERPTEEEPVPPGLDWDLWLGPAPARPFHSVYFPGPKWYRWWDFGNGTMSDLGSHWVDLPFWALGLDAPLTIEAFGPPPHAEIAPASMSAAYEYGARDGRPPVKVTWYQGAMKPKPWTENAIPQWPSGVLFVGDKGMLLSDYSKYVLLPEKDFVGFTPPPKTISDEFNHHQQWVHAIKNGGKTGSPFSYAGPLSEANHLGNVAFRAGKKLEWDSKAMRFTNAPDAERFLGREYRKGWAL
jgi:predicted dehydrogenase